MSAVVHFWPIVSKDDARGGSELHDINMRALSKAFLVYTVDGRFGYFFK